jgi:hypothetical protein
VLSLERTERPLSLVGSDCECLALVVDIVVVAVTLG